MSVTATVLSAYALDAYSTSNLWAELQGERIAGSYTSQFQHNAANWQTAIVGPRRARKLGESTNYWQSSLNRVFRKIWPPESFGESARNWVGVCFFVPTGQAFSTVVPADLRN
jgi:hypothetical protein